MAAHYLRERHTTPPEEVTEIVVQGENRPYFAPHFVREPSQCRVTYFERDRQKPWLISPRAALAGTVLGLVGFNIGANMESLKGDIADEAKQVTHAVDSWLNPPQDKTVTYRAPRMVPPTYKTVSLDLKNTNQPGVSAPDEEKIGRFFSKFNGNEIKGSVVIGRSSDDYGSDATIGVKESPKQDFADERAEATAAVVRDQLQAMGSNAPVETRVNQDVLTQQEKEFLTQLSEEFGYDSLTAAIHAVEAGTETRPALTKLVDEYFTTKRGTTIKVTIDRVDTPARTVYDSRTITYTGEAAPAPDDPDRDYRLWPFIVIPPIPRIHTRRGTMRTTRRRLRLWEERPTYEYHQLEPDETLLRLRPEVINADGTFNDEPWAYTRKFEHLVRDDRISHILKADWQNSKGEAKTMRVFFVDNAPNDATVEAFQTILARVANMEDGAVADRLSAIFVHPSSQAGVSPHNIKRVGPGLDFQEDANTLGYCMPFMRMVEMHMPDPSSASQAELDSFYGGIWTLAHEVAGHGTDIDDSVLNRLIPIGVDTYQSVNLFADNGNRLADDTEPLDTSGPTYFDMEHIALDRQGRPVQRRTLSELREYPLTHATEATIVGNRPTHYAGTSDGEHHAEVAANVTTGIEVPFGHIGHDNHLPGDVTTNGETPDFAQSYRADVGSQEIYTDHVGALSGSYPIEFANPAGVAFSLTRPRFDPETRQRIVDAKSRRFPLPTELVRVVGRVRN